MAILAHLPRRIQFSDPVKAAEYLLDWALCATPYHRPGSVQQHSWNPTYRTKPRIVGFAQKVWIYAPDWHVTDLFAPQMDECEVAECRSVPEVNTNKWHHGR
jgi:hypothetical protein